MNKPHYKHTPKGPVIQNRYDAAGQGRRMAGWQPPGGGPNSDLDGIAVIRRRLVDAISNEWAAKSIVEKWTTTLIGVGVTARFPDQPRLTALWKKHIAECDADGVYDLFGLQTLATNVFVGLGESFTRARYRRANSGLSVPVQYQVMEPQMLPMLDADTWTGLPAGHIIRCGIELDRSRQRSAYWFHKDHPGDRARSTSLDPTGLIRVPAEDVAHMYEPRRAGALRGVGDITTSLPTMRDTSDYADAVLLRQKLSNLFVAFIKRVAPNIGEDPFSGDKVREVAEQFVASLEPGLVQELDPGQEVQFSNPPEAGTMFHEYMRTQYLGINAGAGMPYELGTGDIREVSDRTLRVIINEFRRRAEQRQWQVVIPQFCRRVARWFAETAFIEGKISSAEYDAAIDAEWAPHGFDYIHPVQDVQGQKLARDLGLVSTPALITRRGDDPDTVIAEQVAYEKKLMDARKAAGVPDPNMPPESKVGGDGNDIDEDGRDDDEYEPQKTVAPVK